MLSPERRKLLDSLVENGATIEEIHRKHKFNHKTIRKYYPDYRKGPQGTVHQAIERNKELVDSLIAERAPGSAIAAAIGVKKDNLYKNRPDLVWTRQEAAEFAAMVSQMSRLKGV